MMKSMITVKRPRKIRRIFTMRRRTERSTVHPADMATAMYRPATPGSTSAETILSVNPVSITAPAAPAVAPAMRRTKPFAWMGLA